MTRQQKIIHIARSNALEGLDQRRVDDYEENMRETIAGLFPDFTREEARLAEETFSSIVAVNR